ASSADSANGSRELLVGRRAHRKRVARETGDRSLTPHGAKIPPTESKRLAARGSTLVDVSAHACPRDPRLCLLCHSDGEISTVVRVRGHRTRESPATAFDCDRTSQ